MSKLSFCVGCGARTGEKHFPNCGICEECNSRGEHHFRCSKSTKARDSDADLKDSINELIKKVAERDELLCEIVKFMGDVAGRDARSVEFIRRISALFE